MIVGLSYPELRASGPPYESCLSAPLEVGIKMHCSSLEHDIWLGVGLLFSGALGVPLQGKNPPPENSAPFPAGLFKRFSVFCRSHRLAQALGPNKTIYPRFQLVNTYPTR